MHIPDGFLSTPVWATLDLAAASSAGYLARLAQKRFEQSRVPLLGVMGAFVFAAQMVNFPVGPGTSGHLVGSALLAITMGPAAAAVIMASILAIQALVFQDGGILALGANVFNMALAGVLAGYLPYRIWGSGRGRTASIFAGGALSVLVSAMLAIVQLSLSGIRMPYSILGVSFGLFTVTALLEGAITIAVIAALERINPGFVERPESGRRVIPAMLTAALLLAVVGVTFASAAPDGLERLAQDLGISSQAKALIPSPAGDYTLTALGTGWLSEASAGVLGLGLVLVAWVAFGRFGARRGSN